MPSPSSKKTQKNNLSSRILQPALNLFSGVTARKGYLSMVDQGVISLSNFIAAVYIARTLIPKEFGVYAVGYLLLRFVRSAQEGLIIQPMTTFGAPLAHKEYRRYFTNSFIFQLIFSLSFSIGAAVVGRFLTDLGNDTAGPALFSLWFVFLLWPLEEFLRRAFYTRGKIIQATVISLMSNTFRIGFLLWLGSNTRLTPAGGLDAIAWGSVIALIPGLLVLRKDFTLDLSRTDTMATARNNWEFGRWVLGAIIANWVAIEVYPLITAGMISFAATGAYRAVQNLVAPVHVLLRGMDTFLTPLMSRNYNQGGTKYLANTLKLAYYIAILPILAILIFATIFSVPLLRILYADTYIAYADGVILIATFYFLWFSYWPLQTAFKALKRTRPIFIANITAILTMFTVGLALVSRFGVYGAFAGQAVNALITSILLWRAWFKLKREDQPVKIDI